MSVEQPKPDDCPPHEWTRGDVKESSYCLKCGVDANEPAPKEDVRVCECHPGIYWRRMGPQDGRKIRAGGFATRNGFSGGDLLNAYMFEPAAWEAMKRA